MKLRCT